VLLLLLMSLSSDNKKVKYIPVVMGRSVVLGYSGCFLFSPRVLDLDRFRSIYTGSSSIEGKDIMILHCWLR
jgi:hypothetical protein